MYKIIELLSTISVVKDFRILKHLETPKIVYFKIKAVLKNDSILYIREIATAEESAYSYHWQTKTGKIIIRWDNSPHRKVETFPHHKHIGTRVEPSREVTLQSVLAHIEQNLG